MQYAKKTHNAKAKPVTNENHSDLLQQPFYTLDALPVTQLQVTVLSTEGTVYYITIVS